MKITTFIKKTVISFLALGTLLTNTTSTLPIKAATHTVTTGNATGYNFQVTNADGIHSQWDSNASIIKVDGEIAFCIQPGYVLTEGSNFISSQLTWSQKDQLSIIAYEGWEKSSKTNEDWLATQFYIWETLGATINSSSFLSAYNATYKPAIKSRIAKHDTRPSFHNGTYELNVGESITLTDNNGVLSDFFVSSNGGATVSKNGNKLTISTNNQTSENIEIRLRKVPSSLEGISLIYSNGSQDVGKFFLRDPISAQIYIKVNKAGSLKLVKQDEDGTKVANTSFKVSKNSDMSSPIGTYTTGTDGSVTVNDLLGGTYYVQESSVPNHLNLDSTIRAVTVTANQTTTFTATNTWKKGKVKLRKIDSQTGKQVGGATYAIYNAQGQEVERLVVPNTGYVESGYLRFGNYTVKEVIAPTGYILNTKAYSVAITQNEQKLEVTAEDEPIEGKIKLKKADSQTGKQIGNAIYGIYDASGSEVQRLTTQASGYVESKLLRYGTYTVKEITAPTGYVLNTKAYTVKVTTDGQVVTVNAEDKPIEGKIKLKKADSLNGSQVGGAVYGIYDASGNEVQRLTTQASGYVESKLLRYGTYTVKEITAPTGYVLNTKVYTVQVTTEGQVITVNAEDKPIQGYIQVVKKDIDTGKTVTKANTTFSIYKSDDTYIGDITTNNNGTAKSSLLRYGDYYLVEKTAPNGYTKSTQKITYKIREEGKTYSAELSNKRVTASLSMTKVDSVTGNTAQGEATLEGAVYGLYARENILDPADGSVLYKAGAKVKELKTDAKGKASVSNLYLGKYYLKEITASKGYTLDTTEYDVVLSYKDQNTAVITKTQTVKERVIAQAFELIKISDNNAGEADVLEGVEFTIKSQADIEKYGSWEKAPIAKNAQGKEAKVLVTDKKGYALSEELPYGTYVVRETKVPDDLYQIPDFTVTVSKDSRDPQPWRVFNDEKFRSVIAIVKQDAETNETVAIEGATFKIRSLKTNDYVGYWEWTPIPHYVTEWSTNELGTVMTGDVLDPGEYQLEEIKAPNGYLLNTQPVKFKVSMNTAYETLPDGATPVITVIMKDTSVKGKIRIKKEGEVLHDAKHTEDGVVFEYQTRGLENAEYGIYAAEDIKNASQTNNEYNKDELVQKLITNQDGYAESMPLPLGSYYVKEIKAPLGYVLSDDFQYVDLVYEDAQTSIVQSDIITFYNEREKIDVEAVKYDKSTKKEIAGTEISLYANRDIYNIDGDIVVKANTLIEKVMTDENGVGLFQVDLPYDLTPQYGMMLPNVDENKVFSNISHMEGDENGLYYVMETKAPIGYQLTDEDRFAYMFNFEKGKEKSDSRYVFAFYNEPTDTIITKVDEDGNLLAGAHLAIYDQKGKEIKRWISTNSEYHVHGLHIGEEYVIKELEAPKGYVKGEDITFKVSEEGSMKVEVKNNQTKVKVYKVDADNQKLLTGAQFMLCDDKGIKIMEWESDLSGKLIKGLEVGKRYTIKEVKAPKGYQKRKDLTFVVRNTQDIQEIYVENEKELIIKNVDTFDNTNILFYQGLWIGASVIMMGFLKYCKKVKRK